jgi:NADH-quinone oxidoreductase subunit M
MEKILTYIIFLPAVSALVMAFSGVSFRTLRIGSILSSIAVLFLSMFILLSYDTEMGGMQFVRSLPWISSYGISYSVGVDIVSLVIVSMTALLMPLLHIYMWNYEKKGYWYSMLMLHTGVTGAVLAQDLLLFYLFWETMLVPIFVMIGKYGHDMNRYNAMKIFLMTVLGSMAMLFSILYLGFEHFDRFSKWSFSLHDLSRIPFDPQTSLSLTAGFLLAFVIKIPLPGFHTWMAPAYGSAPTPALVILSSIMAKLGVYGIWRFGYGLFGDTIHHYEKWILALSVIGMVYYAVRAVGEENLRRMFAFSSGSHLSLTAMGIVLGNIYAWSGSLFFIASHAISSASLFLMTGMLYRRTGSVKISDLGGIASKAPIFALFFVFFALATVGVPGTAGFAGELMIIIGAFKESFVSGFAASVTMLTAMIFIFTMLRRVIYSADGEAVGEFYDLKYAEMAILIPLALLLLVGGVAPSLFMDHFQTALVSIPGFKGGL